MGQQDMGLMSITEGSLLTLVIRALQSVKGPGKGAPGSPLHPSPQC